MKEIRHEEAFYGRADHWIPAGGEASLPVKELCRRHGFSEASYYLRRSKFGGRSVWSFIRYSPRPGGGFELEQVAVLNQNE